MGGFETAALPLGDPAVEFESDHPAFLHDDRVNAARVNSTRAAYDKKNKHRCQLGTGVRTRRKFHGGCFGVSGTPPGA